MSGKRGRDPATYRLDIGWFHHDPRSTDPKHLTLHVAKVAGRLAAYEEAKDHEPASAEARVDLLEKRIPDLFILGAMLAEAHGLTRGEVEEMVARRSREVMGRGRP